MHCWVRQFQENIWSLSVDWVEPAWSSLPKLTVLFIFSEGLEGAKGICMFCYLCEIKSEYFLCLLLFHVCSVSLQFTVCYISTFNILWQKCHTFFPCCTTFEISRNDLFNGINSLSTHWKNLAHLNLQNLLAIDNSIMSKYSFIMLSCVFTCFIVNSLHSTYLC